MIEVGSINDPETDNKDDIVKESEKEKCTELIEKENSDCSSFNEHDCKKAVNSVFCKIISIIISFLIFQVFSIYFNNMLFTLIGGVILILLLSPKDNNILSLDFSSFMDIAGIYAILQLILLGIFFYIFILYLDEKNDNEFRKKIYNIFLGNN